MCEVSIRPISIDDTDNIVKWRNTPSVIYYLFNQKALSKEQHINYYNNVVLTGKCEQFIIEVKGSDGIIDIGTIFIKNIDRVNRCGEYGIFIGDENSRGKGYAKTATALILNYGFEKLNLHRISLSVLADNTRAIQLYKDIGFKEEGVEREAYYRNEGYVDIIHMGLLKNEWIATL